MILVIPKFKKVQKLIDKINNTTREQLTGIRVVRAFNAEEYQEEKFDEGNRELTKIQMFKSTHDEYYVTDYVLNYEPAYFRNLFYWSNAN